MSIAMENHEVVLLQQCLPFTVLKLYLFWHNISVRTFVATVLTVYGIETRLATADGLIK